MQDLIEELKAICASAPEGDRVVRIHLFGIKSASRLKGVNLKDLAARAGIRESFETELRKGVRLAEFVNVS